MGQCRPSPLLPTWQRPGYRLPEGMGLAAFRHEPWLCEHTCMAVVKDAISQALRLIRSSSRRGTSSSLDSASFVNLIGAAFELDDTNRRWLSQEYTRDADVADSPVVPASNTAAADTPTVGKTGNRKSVVAGAPTAAATAAAAAAVPAVELPLVTVTMTTIGALALHIPSSTVQTGLYGWGLQLPSDGTTAPFVDPYGELYYEVQGGDWVVTETASSGCVHRPLSCCVAAAPLCPGH